MTNETTSLAALMLRNMETVFGEADAGRRIQNISGLYAERSTIFEADKVVRGHAEIAEMVTALRASLPDGARFEPVAPPLAHHDVGRVNWRLVLGGQVLVTGTDVAFFAASRIERLFVFVDAPPTHPA